MKRSNPFYKQTDSLFENTVKCVPIDQRIKKYKSGIDEVKSHFCFGCPTLVRPDLYLYGDLKRADDLLKQHHGYTHDFYKDCVRNLERHQWCMSDAAANAAASMLISLGLPGKQDPSFDILYEEIAGLIGGINGVGRCAIYDAALRIGHTIGLEPDKYVYIHDGLRKCAGKILGRDIHRGQVRIPRKEFDSACLGFKKMPSMEIEDFICTYKNVI